MLSRVATASRAGLNRRLVKSNPLFRIKNGYLDAKSRNQTIFNFEPEIRIKNIAPAAFLFLFCKDTCNENDFPEVLSAAHNYILLF